MTTNLPRAEAIQVAQSKAAEHGRELVVKMPTRAAEREQPQGDERDSRELRKSQHAFPGADRCDHEQLRQNPGRMTWDMGVSIGFHSHGGIPHGWFISWKTQSKMDELGVPSFQETSVYPPAN